MWRGLQKKGPQILSNLPIRNLPDINGVVFRVCRHCCTCTIRYSLRLDADDLAVALKAWETLVKLQLVLIEHGCTLVVYPLDTNSCLSDSNACHLFDVNALG